MWNEFLEFFGSGNPDMFDTDEEFEEAAPPNDTMVTMEEEMPIDEVQL